MKRRKLQAKNSKTFSDEKHETPPEYPASNFKDIEHETQAKDKHLEKSKQVVKGNIST